MSVARNSAGGCLRYAIPLGYAARRRSSIQGDIHLADAQFEDSQFLIVVTAPRWDVSTDDLTENRGLVKWKQKLMRLVWFLEIYTLNTTRMYNKVLFWLRELVEAA